MNKIISIFIAFLVVGGIIYLAFNKNVIAPTEEVSNARQYTSSEYGLSFEYPAQYFLEEEDVDGSNGNQHLIILTEDTQENKDIRDGKSPGREGPTSIMISVYANATSKPVDAFIRDSADLSYQFGDKKLSTTSIGTFEAYESTWSGLYEGKSYMVSRGPYVYTFSVTWLDSGDKILSDFMSILDTLVIQ